MHDPPVVAFTVWYLWEQTAKEDICGRQVQKRIVVVGLLRSNEHAHTSLLMLLDCSKTCDGCFIALVRYNTCQSVTQEMSTDSVRLVMHLSADRQSWSHEYMQREGKCML